MSNSPKGVRPKALKTDDLRKLLSEIIKSGTYEFQEPESLHARFDHLERKIDTNDVLFGLQQEFKIRNTEFNEDEWQWKYEIATKDVEGDPITAIVAVDTRNKLFEVVTRWRDQA